MELDFTDVSLLRSKNPSIERVIVPSLTRQGERWLGAAIGTLGRSSEDYALTVRLVNSDGATVTEVQNAMSAERSYRVHLDMSGVKAGIYSLRTTISDKDGSVVSEQERKVEVAGEW
jgi:hypothetical protein